MFVLVVWASSKDSECSTEIIPGIRSLKAAAKYLQPNLLRLVKLTLTHKVLGDFMAYVTNSVM